MKIWFLEDLRRLQLEQQQISRLLQAADWLLSAVWNFANGQLVVNAIIQAHNHEYAIVLVYPNLFPEVPAFVRPSVENEIWSEHQYQNGTLCLEWGPDTWDTSVTGSQLLESTFRLLDIENPQADVRGSAPSRHQLSLGQELRFQYGRVFLTQPIQAQFSTLHLGSWVRFDYIFLSRETSLGLLPYALKFSDGTHWKDDTIPSMLTTQNTYSGGFVSSNLTKSLLDHILDFNALRSALASEINVPIEDWFADTQAFLIIIQDVETDLHAYLVFSSDNQFVSHRVSIIKSDGEDLSTRLPAQYHQISSKSVGIVGLGSVGSKVASYLARSGITKFVFVDDDIFMPGNISRHILDWRNVGEHKVDALKHELSYIIDVSISAFKFSIGGQESSSVLSERLSQLGQCDMIIDATADAHTFNMLSAVATYYNKPMIWVEVFAGGIGGFIGRSRPNFDLDPQSMRRIYNSFTAQHATVDMPTPVKRYTGLMPDKNIWQATDADVSIIAAHTARLVLDTLNTDSPSIYPYSMYLIGLQRAWIFSAPFHTIPIAAPDKLTDEDPSLQNEHELALVLEFLKNLLNKDSHEDSNSADSV